jgi:lipoprotein-releasing system permease protein
MYKLLLCWRYLLTRYLALACIVSVMLGVATLIVVNSVMAGFSAKLQDRLHGFLADILIEADSFNGFSDPEGKMARIRSDPFLNEKIEAMAPTMEIFAILQIPLPGGEPNFRPITLIGIDPQSKDKVGGFSSYLLPQEVQGRNCFDLRPEVLRRFDQNNVFPPMPIVPAGPVEPGDPPPPVPPPIEVKLPEAIILGNGIASYRVKNAHADTEAKDVYVLHPGDEVVVYTVMGPKLSATYGRFVVNGYFKSEMSEYDSHFVFVSLKHLQQLRAMDDRVTSIQIKLKDYNDATQVVERLKLLFPEPHFLVQTWEQRQGTLLAAISVEKGILNVLLFLIVGVAGFGILAIFTMIVVEKTRDIGILKALGASNGGVMKIFLGYGLLLGVVGAGIGTVLGLVLTNKINDLEKFLGSITGQDLFPRDIYYFDKIPTFVQPWSVVLVNVGAVAIAVVFSVLPALRAALLHPVRALRYE